MYHCFVPLDLVSLVVKRTLKVLSSLVNDSSHSIVPRMSSNSFKILKVHRNDSH